MTEALAPGDVQPATRGEFLAARATAVPELERRIGSPLDLLLNCGLVLGAAFALVMAGTALTDARAETVHVVIAGVMTAGALATVPLMVRRVHRTRTWMAALLAWETAERQARSLPPGHVRPDLRMPFDARQDADFDDVAFGAELWAEFRPRAWWLIKRGIPAGLGLLVGSLLVAEGFGDSPVALAVNVGVAGGYLLSCCLVSAAGMFRTAWRLRRIWQAHKSEIRAWRVERVGPVAAAAVDRAWLRKRWQIWAPFIGVSLVGLAAKVSTTPPEVVGIVAAIVVLGGFITGIVLLVRRLRRRPASPAEHDLTAVPPG